MDDILQYKEKIEYTEVSKSLKSGLVLFIEGRPGSGKTTFIHKLARDWAAQSGGPIRLLLLISLRMLNNFTDPGLSDILKLFKDLRVSQKLIEERAGKGVCFIFDGFDEFALMNENESIVYKIIKKSYLSQSIVVVASRPAAIAKLRQKADKIVEVLGFLNEQIFEYFEHYPFSSSAKPAELVQYLHLHPNILHMCYLPVHATMVAFLFEVTGKVPKTETEIYKHFAHFTLIRSLSKNKGIDVNDIDIHSLSGDDEKCFKQICQLAYSKTLSNKQVLHQDEVSSFFKHRKGIEPSLGLITIDRTIGLYGFKDIYTFLHLTFQEYLSAYHISTLSDAEQKILIEEHGGKTHMSVVWKFYCGLTDIKPHDNKFKLILQKTKNDTLYHFQCAYECQQKIPCAQLLKTINYHIELSNKYLSTPDFTAIGYVTDTTVIPIKLSLLNVNEEAIDALLSEMKDRARASIHSLHMKTEALDDTQMKSIQKLLANLVLLRHLSLKAKEARKLDIPPLAVDYQFSNLTRLSLVNIDIPSLFHPRSLAFLNLSILTFKGDTEGLQVIAVGLQHSKDLTKLNLSGSHTEELTTSKGDIEGLEAFAVGLKCGKKQSGNNVQVLAESLKNCKCLKEINISDSSLPCSMVEGILESTKHCTEILKAVGYGPWYKSTLRSLRLANLQILELTAATQEVFVFIKNCKRLKELKIIILPPLYTSATSCFEELKELQTLEIKGISNLDGATGLLGGLKYCPILHKLDLSGNDLSFDDIEPLAAVLKELTTLRELYLNNCQIGDSGITVISSCFPHYHSLQRLHLNNNFISNTGAMTLAKNLQYCTELKLFELKYNQLDDELARRFKSLIKYCVTLDISGNFTPSVDSYRSIKGDSL